MSQAYTFKKAEKRESKLRLAIYGPSGGGKTWTSLAVATGIGGPIAVIDTERGSASLYSDIFDFDVLELDDKTVDSYVQAIMAGARHVGSNGTLIIDSLSHGWFELLQEINRVANAKFGGNTWAAWSEGTPKQRRMIDALLDADCHIIATMRSKTVWEQVTEGNRKKYQRIGLDPEQGKGIEYEFTLLMSITPEHLAMVEKDRTGKFQDKIIELPGADFGKQLIEWLHEGVELASDEQKEKIRNGIYTLMGDEVDIDAVLLAKGKSVMSRLTESDASDVLDMLEKANQKKAA